MYIISIGLFHPRALCLFFVTLPHSEPITVSQSTTTPPYSSLYLIFFHRRTLRDVQVRVRGFPSQDDPIVTERCWDDDDNFQKIVNSSLISDTWSNTYESTFSFLIGVFYMIHASLLHCTSSEPLTSKYMR